MILRRYLTQQVATTTVLLVGFLLVLILGGRLIRYFGMAVEGGLDVGLIFSIIGYNVPFLLELILPLAFFIALMLVFGRLYVDNEMLVLNGSGLSRLRVAGLLLPLFVGLFLLQTMLAFEIKPWGIRKTEQIWYEQGLKSAFDLIKPKQVISSGGYHLYIGGISEDKKQLQDVILIQMAEVDEKHTPKSQKTSDDADDPPNDSQTVLQGLAKDQIPRDKIILAKRAEQVPNTQLIDQNADPDKPEAYKVQLDLYQGRRYEVSADSQKYNQVSFERYRFTLKQPPKKQKSEDNWEQKSFSEVWLGAQDKNLQARAELGYRLGLPWLIGLAPLLASALAQVRPRQGRWLKLLPAILIFVSMALILISLKNPIAKGKVSAWAYAWVLLGFFGFALFLNRSLFGFNKVSIKNFSKNSVKKVSD